MAMMSKSVNLLYTSMGKERKMKWTGIFLLYTLLFCVFTAGIFAVLILSHRSVIQFHDAYKQGVFRLIELKNQMHNIMNGEGFSFWSWYEGPGLDEPLENFVDPCSVIGALFPPRYIELGFTVAALLRMYFGGIAFIILGREVELKDKQTLAGAILYAFSACFIGLALRQSEQMINAYLFPILVGSVDRIYKGKRPVLFTLTVAYYMLLSVYFAYMSAIAIIMYILLRYFAYNDAFSLKDYVHTVSKFIGYGLIGIFLTAFSSAFSAFSILRASTDSTSGSYGLLFDADWYTTFGKMLLGTGATYDYSDIGPHILILMLMPIAVRYCTRKSTNTIMSILLFFMMLIPFFSSMFNGFGYTTPRWSYTLLLFMVWSGIEQLDAEKIKRKSNLLLAGAGLGMMAIWTLGLYSAGIIPISRTGKVFVPFQLGAGLAIIALFALIKKNEKIGRKEFAILMLIPLISLSAGWSVGFRNNIDNFAHNATVYKNLQESTLRVGNQIKDKGFYRIDSVDSMSRHVEIKFPTNENIWWRTNNLIIYNSRIPKTLTDFNVEMGNSYGYARRVFVLSNGNRPGLDFLSGVRYFLGSDENRFFNEDSDNYAGYGFEPVGVIDDIHIFKNKYDAGLGFILDNVILESDFRKLNRVQREQALLQAAVVPDAQSDKCDGVTRVDSDDLDFDITELPYEVVNTNGLTFEQNRFIAEKRGASITIRVKDIPEGQLMVSFDGLLRNTKDGIDGGSYEIHVSDGRVVKQVINQHSRQGVSGLKNHDLCLGSVSGEDEIKITFSDKGTYTFDRLYISSMSNENYDRFASKCASNSLDVSVYDNKHVEAAVDAENEGILFLSIPAYDNWDVYVDGEKTDRITDLDIAFMGVKVPAGKHTITLRYNNRLVRCGCWVSLAGAILFALFVMRKRTDCRPQYRS